MFPPTNTSADVLKDLIDLQPCENPFDVEFRSSNVSISGTTDKIKPDNLDWVFESDRNTTRSAFDRSSLTGQNRQSSELFVTAIGSTPLSRDGFPIGLAYAKVNQNFLTSKKTASKIQKRQGCSPKGVKFRVREANGSASAANEWRMPLQREDSFFTGPFPLHLEDSDTRETDTVDKMLDETVDTTTETTATEDMLNNLELDFDNETKMKEILMQYAAHRASTRDTDAFDNIPESLNNNKAINSLAVSTPDRSHVTSRDLPSSFISSHRVRFLEDTDHHRQSKDKREVMALALTSPSVPRRRRWRSSSSGQVTGSGSGGGGDLERSRRAVGGVNRRKPGHRYHQSSLRDDFLCGMESKGSEGVAALRQARPIEEPWVCNCGDDDDNSEITFTKGARQKRNHQQYRSQDHSLKVHSFSSSQAATPDADKGFSILSPSSNAYFFLRSTDAAFDHAVNAGSLWQSLVRQHVRFPWPTSPLGCHNKDSHESNWIYYDRHRIQGNTFLNSKIKRRDDPGALLLHVIVRDFMTGGPILDVVIGCFHPNAKSVRTSKHPKDCLNGCRDLWVATRFRTHDSISVVDPGFLCKKMGQPKKTPLGNGKRRITNNNIRAVFGESPPSRTLFLLESELYEILTSVDHDTLSHQAQGPADVLLGKYVVRHN